MSYYLAYIENEPLDHDALLADLYELQANLKILAEQLARSRNPDLSRQTLCILADMHNYLKRSHVSLRRH